MGAAGTVLILTHPFDPTADKVVDELNRRDVPLFRCDAADFPENLRAGAELLGLLQITALAACGVVDLALAAFPQPWVAALAWGMTGFAFAVWIVLSVSARQRLIPPELLARVNSAGRTVLMAATPLGALAGGVLADMFGLRAPALISGVALLVLAACYGVTSWPDRHLLQGRRIAP